MCEQCARPRNTSPSDWFCSEDCQREWLSGTPSEVSIRRIELTAELDRAATRARELIAADQRRRDAVGLPVLTRLADAVKFCTVEMDRLAGQLGDNPR